MASFCGGGVMLYDIDICKVGIRDDKILIEYYGPTEEATFTRDDLLFLLEQLDLDKEILSGEKI